MRSNDTIRVQGRTLTIGELWELQGLIDRHPQWSRHRLAQELCQQWAWQTPTGQLKTFAARSLLLKLAERYGLGLPPVRVAYRRHPWGLRPQPSACLPEASMPIGEPLAALRPLRWELAEYGSSARRRALNYLRHYHYLGCNRPVGVHLLYLVQDVQGRDLGVHLVGAAAWQCAPRDRYIGWSEAARRAHLFRIANHSRFLILPWVVVPHLASHMLGQLARRLGQDWPARHGWALELIETFVECGRFAGTAYRAANWQRLGQTTGRTRQEKAHRVTAPAKSVWVYALHPLFRQRLTQGTEGRRS